MTLRGLPAQLPALVIAGLLATFSTALLIADYSNAPVESPQRLRLGRFYLLDDGLAVASLRDRLDDVGFKNAAIVFEAALKRDPGSAPRWLDYGEAALAAGDIPRAAYSYDRARQLAPHDVLILFDAADFYATHGKPEAALDAFSIILRESGAPKNDVLTNNVFVEFEALKVRQNKMLDRVIPDAVNAWAYLRFLIAKEPKGDGSAAREIWNWLSAKHYDDDTLVADYSRYMLGIHQFEAAGQAWSEHFNNRRGTLSGVFNGGFEYDFLNAPLDWRDEGFSSVRTQRDSEAKFEGKYSIRVTFTGNDNPDYHHFGQTLLLAPGRYRISAQLRTAGITSDEGIRLRTIVTGDPKQIRAESPALSGTNNWTPISLDLNVTAGTPAVELQISRHRSLRVDNQLKGTAWLDDVRISKIP